MARTLGLDGTESPRITHGFGWFRPRRDIRVLAGLALILSGCGADSSPVPVRVGFHFQGEWRIDDAVMGRPGSPQGLGMVLRSPGGPGVPHPRALAFGDGSRSLGVASSDGSLVRYRLPEGIEVSTHRLPTRCPTALGLAPGEGTALVVDARGGVEALDLGSGRHRSWSPPRGFGTSPASTDETGSRALVATSQGVRILGAPDGKPLASLALPDPVRSGLVVALASPSGERVAAIADGGRVYDTATGEVRFALSCYQDLALAVAFSPDGRLVAASCADGLVVQDTRDGSLVAELASDGLPVVKLRFSPDGLYLGAAAPEARLQLWSLGPEAGHMLLEAHRDPILDFAFSPDGCSLAVSGEGGQLVVWDLEALEKLRRTRTGLPVPARSL